MLQAATITFANCTAAIRKATQAGWRKGRVEGVDNRRREKMVPESLVLGRADGKAATAHGNGPAT
jgi:hypothetical protein